MKFCVTSSTHNIKHAVFLTQLEWLSTAEAYGIFKSVGCLVAGRPAGQVAFPIDFWEHCQQSNDVEFGGNDVLQIYNQAQVKHRLNTNGMYIASTKVCTQSSY